MPIKKSEEDELRKLAGVYGTIDAPAGVESKSPLKAWALRQLEKLGLIQPAQAPGGPPAAPEPVEGPIVPPEPVKAKVNVCQTCGGSGNAVNGRCTDCRGTGYAEVGEFGNCLDCRIPLKKRNQRIPFHAGEREQIVYCCRPCAEARYRLLNVT